MSDHAATTAAAKAIHQARCEGDCGLVPGSTGMPVTGCCGEPSDVEYDLAVVALGAVEMLSAERMRQIAADRPAAAAAMQGLATILAAMKASPDIPAPAKTWPLTWHAPESVDDMDALTQFAASLRLRNGTPREYEEEGGRWSGEIGGYVGGIPVRVTADTGARVLDALPELAAVTAA
jgi:hypothetical protein